MRLENHRRILADPAASRDIAPAVAALTEVGKAYILLSAYDAGAEEYVQAAGTIAEDFIVERRDGCAGEHYRGDQRITAADLVTMLEGYLQGSPTWSHSLTWHQVMVGGNAPYA
jgi:hypothetical protein